MVNGMHAMGSSLRLCSSHDSYPGSIGHRTSSSCDIAANSSSARPLRLSSLVVRFHRLIRPLHTSRALRTSSGTWRLRFRAFLAARPDMIEDGWMACGCRDLSRHTR